MSAPKAMHLLRPAGSKGARRGRRAAAEPGPTYPPGHFTALVYAHNWPPMWQPAELAQEVAPRGRPRNSFTPAQATQLRDEGKGWGHGTVVMRNTPKGLPPGLMRPQR